MGGKRGRLATNHVNASNVRYVAYIIGPPMTTLGFYVYINLIYSVRRSRPQNPCGSKVPHIHITTDCATWNPRIVKVVLRNLVNLTSNCVIALFLGS